VSRVIALIPAEDVRTGAPRTRVKRPHRPPGHVDDPNVHRDGLRQIQPDGGRAAHWIGPRRVELEAQGDAGQRDRFGSGLVPFPDLSRPRMRYSYVPAAGTTSLSR